MTAHASKRGILIHVVMLSTDGRQLLVRREGAATSLPSVLLLRANSALATDFRHLVGARVQEELDVPATVRGLVGAPSSSTQAFLAAVQARSSGSTPELDKRALAWRPVEDALSAIDESFRRQGREASDGLQLLLLGEDYSREHKRYGTTVGEFILKRAATVDGHFGWSQFLEDSITGALSTAQGLLTLIHVGLRVPEIEAAIQTLRTLQNPDGGWPVRHALIGKSQVSVTESTLYCLWALLSAGIPPDDPCPQRALQWLDNAQRSDGGWGSTDSAPRSRTYPTAFALRIYSMVNPASPSLAPALAWLRTAQSADGGWPNASEQAPNQNSSSHPIYTANAVIALTLSAKDDSDWQQIGHALDYIDAGCRTDGSEPWGSTSEVERVASDASLDFRHFTTPWVLCAYLSAGRAISDPHVAHALRWLLLEQHTLGYWPNALVPGQAAVWATHDGAYALSRVEAALTGDTSLLMATSLKERELDLAWNTATDAYLRDQRFALPKSLIAWNAALTFAVVYLFIAVVVPGQSITPGLPKLLAALGSSVITAFGPFLFDLLSARILRGRDDN